MVLSKCRCRSLTQTTNDYASQSSIHGVSYIFDHKLGTWERVLWLMVVIAFLILATHLTLDTWTQWQEEQVVTTLKNTAKPVAEVPFPAVTICGTGNHMSNVEKKIQENFVRWRKENQRNKTGLAMLKDIEDYFLCFVSKSTLSLSLSSSIGSLSNSVQINLISCPGQLNR